MTNIPLYLAPLAGYTDRAFRSVCKEWGADYMLSEMVSADGIIRDKQKTLQYTIFADFERPFGMQIFGSDPDVIAHAAEAILPLNPDFIDLNMGCPVKKVVKRGAGSALMKDPVLASAIVKSTKTVISSKLPLSVKFRSGWDSSNINFLEFGLLMQDSGADIVCLHPRTQKQMFSGKSNWEHIRILKQALSIPVIGNGDIFSPQDAKNMLNDTNCDALMIGRGALGRPWLFAQIKEFLATGEYMPITKDKLLNTAFKHLEYALKFKEERIVVKEMRSQLCHYIKAMPGSKDLRDRLNHTQSAEEIKNLLNKWIWL